MGTRKRFPGSTYNYWDHPHAYGDKFYICLISVLLIGSSPRVWGQVHIGGDFRKSLRIIPTRMGTSPKNLALPLVEQDHPHAYGDKHCNDKCMAKRMGSSPRVWGQGYFFNIFILWHRIIPTRMGTRVFRCKVCCLNQDHPHAYGDKLN